MVLVCHTHEFIFMKTHKTAGTSIEMLFEPFCRPPGYEVTMGTHEAETEYGLVGSRGDGSGRFRNPDGLRGHSAVRVVRGRVGRGTYRRYFKFTAVRNPFDRTIARFLYRRSLTDLPPYETPGEMIDGFEAFLKSYNDKDFRIVGLHGRYLMQDAIRYEHRAEDIDRIAKRLGLDMQGRTLPHARANASARMGVPISDFYRKPESIKRVLRSDKWIFKQGYYPTTLPAETSP